MAEKRNIRVFCPTHEAAFEVAEGPKILCEITEHVLSVGFPHSEFWEFCCNCETFTPSRLDKGEKARAVCYGCGNDITHRCVCADCKTLAFESGSYTKGKRYSISDSGIEPACPGCQAAGQRRALVPHRCQEVEKTILTARAECPFCLEKTDAAGARAAEATVPAAPQTCPNCGAPRIPGANFCGKCRHQLQTDVAVTNLGSEVNRAQLLGSLCPNCSTPLASGASFCPECGQAIKKESPRVVQPPPPQPQPHDNAPPAAPPPRPVESNVARNVIIILGVVMAFAVILAISLSVPKSNLNASYNANTAYTTNTNTTLPTSFERTYDGTINGQTFTLTLVRSGRNLSGTASTTSTDTLTGTIDSDGSFRAEGYENGERLTGIYTGRVYTDGTVNGTWTTPKGKLSTSFYLKQR